MNKKYLALTALTLALTFTLGGCGAAGPGYWNEGGGMWQAPEEDGADGGPNYQYNQVIEQGFKDAREEPASYFSLDRNTANYAYVRAQLNSGLTVANDSVRIEELVNYFSYDYPAPEDGEDIAVSGYLMDCPWNADHKLASFGIRTQVIEAPAECSNYTFLIDVSGSMSANVRGTDMSCLDLVKYGIERLVGTLGENDRVSIVKYASGTGVVLEPTLATEEGKAEILSEVKNLRASGSTNGSGGLQLAYEQAEKYKAANGNNRVILLTDGDFNVGIYNQNSLKELITEKAQSGVYLSVIGVGLGNTRDDLMETLALAGNGNYAYMDSPLEAEKVLVEEANGMLYTVAKDAKAGVTFNPNLVESYRIIGYDMKTMSEQDFNDQNKDAGEIGSNLCVTVMYELVLTEKPAEIEEDGTMSEDNLLATAEIRYKSVENDEENMSVTAEVTTASTFGEDQVFAACVAEFGLVLRRSQYRGTASLVGILERLETLESYLARDVYKTEFKTLVEKAIVGEQYGA